MMDIDDAYNLTEVEEMDRILGKDKNYYKILDETPKYDLDLVTLFDNNDDETFSEIFNDEYEDFSEAFE